MPGAVGTGHSHRPTTKTTHKPFKSRKATKGQLRNAAKGRISGEKGQRKTPHQQVMSKLDRRNQAKQRQLEKAREHQKEASIFAGKDGAPRNVAVIPLCADSDAAAAIRSLNESVDIDAEVHDGCFRVPVDRFKQKLQYVPLNRDLTACLDAARVADFIVLVLSAEVEVDDLGELILRSVEGQGMSTLFTVVQGLNKIEPAKQRLSVVSSLKSYITHFHPEQEKIYSLDNRQECANLMRSLCSTTPKGIRWRDERSWMLVEDIQWATSGLAPTILTGVVRGRGLKADRLVQVGDWGTFQIEKITAAPLATRKRKGEDTMNVEDGAEEETLELPTEEQDTLDDLAPEEAAMGDGDEDMDAATTVTTSRKGVLLDDHHYFSDDDRVEELPMPKKLPRGTSKYQAAWFLADEDVSDSGSDLEDYDMQDADGEEEARPEDGMEGLAGDAMTEAGPSEYPQSVAFIEPDEDEDARALEAYRKSKRTEAEDDLEFPDEIELHPKVLARERLAKYRGLKSLRTSPWLEDEDRAFEPEEWQRLLRIPDYKASRIRAAREALVGGVAPGTRVHVYVKGVPVAIQKSYNPSRPVTLFSLLRHEQKRTAVNVLINLSSDFPSSIKAKEELIVQYGPRRFVINPLFSQGGTTPNNVHKYCRYLHPGQSAVATFMGPVTWGSVPALFFKRTVPSAGSEMEDEEEGEGPTLPLTLVATGTTLPPSTSRVIAKRAILTGHPYHIHKKIVTIRYMFFNREDVEWFKALPLWTKRGRSGYIKEPLGTHGYFKATFDGRINPQDTIGVSLYKRVWPRNARPLEGLLLDPALVQAAEADAMDADVE
ncbi:93dd2741-2ad2-4634-9cb9-48c5b2295d65 [Thermothielavioides terrestris]|uniref:93dd2741-2ad2-4634-9cb9-48c5b2295d65 n=1 Tax=Thermothielavioides terrestris TaxID=2587410 RepID=A0A3S4F8G6_9PEZI|nr:93dd2741-2ad2-4634-9cb9-48c5b2295d65 [Thermothielavioides terrestris]